MEIVIEKHKKAGPTLLYDAQWRETLCETLRMICDDVYDYPDKALRENIISKLTKAMEAAGKMAERLAYYEAKYNDTTGNNGANLPLIPNYRENKKRRRARMTK